MQRLGPVLEFSNTLKLSQKAGSHQLASFAAPLRHL
jgi:hypothetical protein